MRFTKGDDLERYPIKFRLHSNLIGFRSRPHLAVMPGLVPGIHALHAACGRHAPANHNPEELDRLV